MRLLLLVILPIAIVAVLGFVLLRWMSAQPPAPAAHTAPVSVQVQTVAQTEPIDSPLRSDADSKAYTIADGESECAIEFTLHNDGSDTIHIESIQGSCGCLSIQSGSIDLAAGEQYLLNAVIRAPSTGFKTEYILLHYHIGDSQMYQKKLTLNINGSEMFKRADKTLSWKLSDHKHWTAKKTTVTAADHVFRIMGIEQDPGLKKYFDIQFENDGKVIHLTVTPRSGDMESCLKVLNVLTNSPEPELAKIPITLAIY